MKLHAQRGLALLAGLMVVFSASAANTPDPEEMWRIIQQQQRQIEELQAQLTRTSDQAQATDEKVEVVGDMLEQLSYGDTSGGDSWTDRTRIGGYGELHYNNLDSKEELDFHRFVLYFNHDFTDRITFVSELELEHAIAGDGQNGEIELEQAYVNFALGEQVNSRAGLFLMPVGILNLTHEPNTFFGVERNPVEKNIIPTTWWEAGFDFHGELAPGFAYDVAMTSGLDVPTTGSKAFLIRNGRQKGSEARADNLAYTGRLKWTGMPGVELALSGQYQDDVTQGDFDVSATLLQAHADIRRGPFGLRALWARWDLDDSGVIDASDPAAIGRDEQEGWYIEPSIRGQLWDIPGEFGAFARYNVWDNNAGASNDTEFTQYDFGINYWPIPEVVLKFDIQQQDNDGRTDDNGYNLGIGYAF
jgi:hypothetical protein